MSERPADIFEQLHVGLAVSLTATLKSASVTCRVNEPMSEELKGEIERASRAGGSVSQLLFMQFADKITILKKSVFKDRPDKPETVRQLLAIEACVIDWPTLTTTRQTTPGQLGCAHRFGTSSASETC